LILFHKLSRGINIKTTPSASTTVLKIDVSVDPNE